ncbi:TerB family tellurite resistance protein [Paraglaciecola sp. 2405UD69-4]|uniref:tellurite resistance TerB family protein n=1 Tax=Paraglaciecola sp. 2405UD69-4 TaxID=3391836 RepID=UPI0039C9D117
MLSAINKWFTQQFDVNDESEKPSIELATAVLLYEVMRADHEFTELEFKNYEEQLNKHFSLSATQLSTLCDLTKKEAEEATDYQQFTRVLNDVYGVDEKRKVLDSLWSIAYADHELNPNEEYTIRKIADLLYLPHSEFIQSKLESKS